MKLLFFIHSLSSGGAERATSNLANYWAKKGWNITIVTLASCDLDFYPLHPGINRIALSLDVESIGLWSALKSNFRRIYELRKVVKQQQPDIALAMMTTANILIALATIGLKTPAIGSERIHPPMFPLGRIWEYLRRFSYSQLSVVTALTEESAIWLKMHTTAKNIPVIPNSVVYPMVSVPPFIKPSLSERQAFNLLAVGRLAPQKGFDRLLRAFAALAPQFPNWHLTFLGEGEGRYFLENMVQELGLEQRISLPGVAGNPSEWYQMADIYVMTSLFEGFPNTLVEAMAYGLPVVSVDCDTGPRDIIRDQVDGLLVPQDNHEALVDALRRLMSSPALRQKYANRAIEIRKRVSMEKVAGMWEKLFKEISK